MYKFDPIKVFVAAAGLGSRLRPITEFLPKPLLPLAGLNLTERIVYSIKESCTISQLGMNLYYCSEKFEEWSERLPTDFPKPQFFYEQELLGTGGALINARAFFASGTVLLVNGDVLSDMDWKGLIEAHRESGDILTLAVQDRAHERRVGVSANNKLMCIDKTMETPGVDRWVGYACAVVYEPEFLEFLPEGESHVVPFWVEAAQASGRVGVHDIGNASWLDLGNANAYAQGVFQCLGSNLRYFSEPLQLPWDLRLEGRCVIEEGVRIGSDVKISESILLPGVEIEDGEQLDHMIVGVGFRVPFEKIPSLVNPQATIGAGGSDRCYYRTDEGVLLQYSPFETNAERQCVLTTLLNDVGIRVPRVLEHKAVARQMFLDDLGDQTFRLWRVEASAAEALVMMKCILDQLIDFQFVDLPLKGIPQDKIFDEQVLLWESSYFLERCVYRFFGMKEFVELRQKEMTGELAKLAAEVASLPRGLMHRDFQSENIMIYQGVPWFIDFQGAHHGTVFYDAASFIADPYMELNLETRLELETYYLSKLSPRLDMSFQDGKRALVLCGLQRHMQALGAYGFLSEIRGKQQFREYIKPALYFLHEEVSFVSNEFPVLVDLMSQLIEDQNE